MFTIQMLHVHFNDCQNQMQWMNLVTSDVHRWPHSLLPSWITNCWLHTEHLPFKPVSEDQFFFSLWIFNKKIHSNTKTKALFQFPGSLWLKVSFFILRCTGALTVHISFGSNRAHGWKHSVMHMYIIHCIQANWKKIWQSNCTYCWQRMVCNYFCW
jgi:hypothetical protein